jgi:NAD(P)-dependent dehydrogenase (short-subunit alcohol dehydrogenase family)/acyl dehydratase
MTTFRFTADELDLFSSASHDRNPLHLSDQYARRTAYGGRVVFGVLDALSAVGHANIAAPSGCFLSSVECEFFDVALLGVDYSVAVTEENPSETIIRVADGRRPIVEMVLTFRAGQQNPFDALDGDVITVFDSRDLQRGDLRIGMRASGRYSVSPTDLADLCGRLRLKQSCLQQRELSAMLWASYLVGMEVPGKRALFSRLHIEFEPAISAGSPFDYQAEVREINESGEVSIEANLTSGGNPWAHATLSAYLREDLPRTTASDIEALVGRSESLRGKVAFISGGSRGLGAALVRALALHGCTVVLNFFQGQADAENIRGLIPQSCGQVLLEKGDVADVAWCLKLEQRLRSSLKRLDFLFCNASPALVPLWLEPSAAFRVTEFVTKSLAMITGPMSALLPLVEDSKGWNVLISSTAVTQPHPYFPHYLVAKAGAEAMVRAASGEYRNISSLIVRPARLLTDLTNTPHARKGSIPPEIVAAAVIRRLTGTASPGHVEVLDRFPSGRTLTGEKASSGL